jgi:site-specific DNA-methyltransferase (adenine-specific)
MVYSALVAGGLEFRGQLIREVQTLRGGDRPKNAEDEFPDVCSLPRGCYEPWGILRKPLPAGLKVSDCLRQFEAGGLRRLPDGLPFSDLVAVGRTPVAERKLAKHPSLKPQALLRELVYAVLPLGKGIVLDPFMGSGSTVAAGSAMSIQCVGVEKNKEFFEAAEGSIDRLSKVVVAGDQLKFPLLT